MLPADGKTPSKNLAPSPVGIPVWNADDVNGSLQAHLLYVEQEAGRAIQWYWANKRSKAFYSQVIRFAAFSLTALGGLLPIVITMLNPVFKALAWNYEVPESGLCSSLLVGIAAALYGIDKAFGLSSGWTRYVLTATVLEKSLEEFRLQWTMLMSKLGRPPFGDQIDALLKCALDFRMAVAAAVLQETKDWVTEFQNNLGQLERDTRTQLDALSAKVEKTIQSQIEQARPGAVELTIPDADAAGFLFAVTLDGQQGSVLKETVRNSRTWSAIGVEPGQHRLLVSATIGGRDTVVTKVIVVKSDETSTIEIRLQA